jgi:hypothetical protein
VRFWRRKNRKNMTPLEIAELIQRFLNEKRLYPEEWVEFSETPQHDKNLDVYRKRCDLLDPLVNRPGDMDPTAVAELRSMIEELRRSSAVN